MKDTKFIDLLPDNLKKNNEVIKLSKLIDNHLSKIDSIIDKLTIYARLDDDTLSEKYTDALAKTFHLLSNESYRFASTAKQKRELVRNSLVLHRTKGTKYAVERVCNILEMKEAKLTEWFEDDSRPYTFKINANAFDGLDEETVRLLYGMVNEFKNIRSHVSVFEFVMNTYGNIYLSTNTLYNNDIGIRQYFSGDNILKGIVYMKSGTYMDTDVVIREKSDELI